MGDETEHEQAEPAAPRALRRDEAIAPDWVRDVPLGELSEGFVPLEPVLPPLPMWRVALVVIIAAFLVILALGVVALIAQSEVREPLAMLFFVSMLLEIAGWWMVIVLVRRR